MSIKVSIKTNKFNFLSIGEDSIGIVIREAKNYYNETVYDVKVGQYVLRLTRDEIEKIEKMKEDN